MKQIHVTYGIDTVTKQVSDDTTVGSVLGNPNIKAGLGLGDNVKALSNGVELPATAIVSDGQRLVVETRCNSKAQDTKSITVKYGIDQITKAFPYEATVEDVVGNDNVQAALGYGDNVRALMNGVELPLAAQAQNGTTITVETRCNSKATADCHCEMCR